MSEDFSGGHVTRCPVSDDDRWCYARPGRVYTGRVEVVVRADRSLVVLGAEDARRLAAELLAALDELDVAWRGDRGRDAERLPP